MDFVVVGLGLGTLAILAGVLTFTWVAGRWDRRAAQATRSNDAQYDYAVAATRRGAGQAVIVAGVAVLIATIGALAGSLDDQIGAFFVTTAATVAGCGLLVWAYLHRIRNPLPQRSSPAESRRQVATRRIAIPSLSSQPAKGERIANDDEQPSDARAEEVPVEPREAADALLIEEVSELDSDPSPSAAQDDERGEDGDAEVEDGQAIEEGLPTAAAASESATDEDEESAESEQEQTARKLNGANADPFALHEFELEGSWKVLRGGKT